jgi:hypothetical protein
VHFPIFIRTLNENLAKKPKLAHLSFRGSAEVPLERKGGMEKVDANTLPQNVPYSDVMARRIGQCLTQCPFVHLMRRELSQETEIDSFELP